MAAQPNYQQATREAADRRLLERVVARDREAFRELYVAYHRRLARFLMRLTHRYDVAEEVINDTLWVVWRKAGEFRGESRISTWIMGIAYRRALKTLQAGGMAAAVMVPVDSEPLTGTDEVAATEMNEWISRAMEQLPAEQRLALEFAYTFGHSCEEIAQIMDCPLNTVKTRMFHGREKLRRILPALAGLEPPP
jgi:RNA polymerase sigma-70 factor (ECF subfamily)